MFKTTQSILLADENGATSAFLKDNLAADGYQVSAAADRAQAIALLCVERPALILADLNGQTLELLDAIRSGQELAVDPDTPIIVLSNQPDDVHRVRVLDRGGDEVVSKPFTYPELRARVAALLRRADCRRRPRQLHFGPLSIDLASRQVHLGEERIALSAKEYELLVALASNPHRVFTRQELLRNIWGLPHAQQDRRQPPLSTQNQALRPPPAAGDQRVGRRLPVLRPDRLAPADDREGQHDGPVAASEHRSRATAHMSSAAVASARRVEPQVASR